MLKQKIICTCCKNFHTITINTSNTNNTTNNNTNTNGKKLIINMTKSVLPLNN
jgi:hypothetical protein